MEKITPKLSSLEIKDYAFDYKINALNVQCKISILDYLDIAKDIKNNNDLQRKRVSNPSTVYALLKEDMLNGCLIPSIVLALDLDQQTDYDIKRFQNNDFSEIINVIQVNSTKLKILDGLQRTNILLDLNTEWLNISKENLQENKSLLEKFAKFHEGYLRIEIYINITRFGILYRMLTLNTGQTPMSLRHQIEILYSDYYLYKHDGIVLLRDAFDPAEKIKIGKYRFNDIIEGVTSFIDGSEFTLDRFDLLEYIKTLRKLSREKITTDIFKSFVTTYHRLVVKIESISNAWKFDYEELSTEKLTYFPIHRIDENGKEFRTAPFGYDATDIFLKPQVFTGLGAALSHLKQKEIITEINGINSFVDKICFENTPKDALELMIIRLELIRKESKKIGESQRTFFKYFFISLFNSNDIESFLKIDTAIETAYRKTL